MAQINDQPCWTCKHCYGGCPWTEYDPETQKTRFAPVPGWKIRKVKRREAGGSYGGDGIEILFCPMYEADPDAKRVALPDELSMAPCCEKCSPYTRRICNSGKAACRELRAWRAANPNHPPAT